MTIFVDKDGHCGGGG